MFFLLGLLAGGLALYAIMHGSLAKMRLKMSEDEARHNCEKQEHIRAIAQKDGELSRMREENDKRADEQMQLIKAELAAASEKLLRERAEQLSADNKVQLSTILDPLHNDIQRMREAVEKADREHTDTMTRLDTTIRLNTDQSKLVGERADRLAQALTGENKTQGNFGELRLKQLLENMELQEGLQFSVQETVKDEYGQTVRDEERHRLVPDFILHFPDKRDLVIDSKMSLTAFCDYCNASTDAQKQDALKRHTASVRNHVNELANKDYSKFVGKDGVRLDFVLMYVFSESALQLALSNDTTLWEDAYKKGIIITGSQSLYTILRVLEATWKQVRQVENQQKIMDCASRIVERVQAFAERFAEVRLQLKKTQECFDKLESVTADSGQSIVTPARQLVNMGARQNAKKPPLKIYAKEDSETPSLTQDAPAKQLPQDTAEA